MSDMAITWVRMAAGVRQDGAPSPFIHTIVERENITTGGGSTPSTVCPTGANCAIVTAVDAALIITSGPATPEASPTNGVDCTVGEKAYLNAEAGVTMIAGIER